MLITSIDFSVKSAILCASNKGAMNMKLTASQFGVLSLLAEFGPRDAVEVLLPPAMDGKRKVKLEWHAAAAPTLAALEAANLVDVSRSQAERPKNAVGKRGHPRRHLFISITEAGRQALAAA